jgi:hypothetical protein
MTLEAWVFPTGSLGRTEFPVIFKGGAPGGHSIYDLYAHSSLGRPSSDVVTGVRTSVIGTAQLSASVWTHLAATYDGSNVKLYVNGTLVGTVAATGSIVQTAAALQLGAASAIGGWFRGRIDEVRIYNRALSPQEIGSDMQTPITP